MRRRRFPRSYALLGVSLAMILVGCGMLLYVAQHSNNEGVTSEGDPSTIPAQCVPTPLSQIPDVLTGFTVPKRITIAKIGVDSKVVPVTAVNGVLDIPDNVDVIGWYQEGATPEGAAGSAVLVGHRDGKLGVDGAFYNLATLRPGDKVEIRDAGGIKSEYEVVAREVIPKSTFASVADKYFTLEGEPRLTMITCGGYYDKDKGGYQSNVVVTARRITHSEPDGDIDWSPLTDMDHDHWGFFEPYT